MNKFKRIIALIAPYKKQVLLLFFFTFSRFFFAFLFAHNAAFGGFIPKF
jgi:hypothetical protein